MDFSLVVIILSMMYLMKALDLTPIELKGRYFFLSTNLHTGDFTEPRSSELSQQVILFIPEFDRYLNEQYQVLERALL